MMTLSSDVPVTSRVVKATSLSTDTTEDDRANTSSLPADCSDVTVPPCTVPPC